MPTQAQQIKITPPKRVNVEQAKAPKTPANVLKRPLRLPRMERLR